MGGNGSSRLGGTGVAMGSAAHARIGAPTQASRQSAGARRRRGRGIKAGIILVPMQNDPRLELVRRWLGETLKIPVARLEPASADASFRRYFRLWSRDAATRIVMDAPPDKEDLGAYLRVSALLEESGVHVPHVHAADTGLGVALLEDLGSTHMLTCLDRGEDPDVLYGAALDVLAGLQLGGDAASHRLPPYDREVLLREMRLMPEWFCGRHLRLDMSAAEQQLLDGTFDFLCDQVLRQPPVFVHRDYHSRNLMVLPERSPGVIDFQDALRGPVAYDLASILKDCYIAWPRARVEAWVQSFRERLVAGGREGRQLAGDDAAGFLRDFDLIGLQRHIKVLGIFARLYWRDGKDGYLGDLPRTLDYTLDAAARIPELARFADFARQRLAPALATANAEARNRAHGVA
jgi:N-acetylmuramate 1-kinase